MTTILRIDASGREDGSISRRLADRLTHRFPADAEVITRDLRAGMPFVDEAWIDANTTPEEARSPDQRAALSLSDALIDEWTQADAVIISTPVYNFGIPAVLKAYVDQICRARKTFRYTPDGPVGMLSDRPVYLLVATGGTEVGSDIDWATGYLTHILAFIGIRNVTVIAADRLMSDPDRVGAAEQALDALDTAATALAS